MLAESRRMAINRMPGQLDARPISIVPSTSGDSAPAGKRRVSSRPGGGGYPEPYFYCTPWPTPTALADDPAPAHWHTEGFTPMVSEARRLSSDSSIERLLTNATTVALDTLQRR